MGIYYHSGSVIPLGQSLLYQSIFFANFWILNLRDKREPVIKLFTSFAFAVPFLFIYLLFTDELIIPEYKTLVYPIYIGLFEMGLTFVLWLKALSLSKSNTRLSNIVYLSPFLSLFFIHYILGESILLSSFIGLSLIVTGIFLQARIKE